jgi:RNA polymerase sigma factor (sigma-70 family)
MPSATWPCPGTSMDTASSNSPTRTDRVSAARTGNARYLRICARLIDTATIEEVEDRLEAGKLAGLIRTAIDDLPDRQRRVVTLRDIEGLSSEEVCSVLAISEANQRVLLHRARSHLRQAVETECGGPS